MDYTQAILLAVVQGITEWLPVSSSGHLVIFQQLLDIKTPVSFDAALHFGTLLAVILFMRNEIASIIASAARLDFKSKTGKLGAYVILATIPVAIAGLLFKRFFESLFTSLPAVTAGLLFTGLLLFISERKPRSEELSAWNTFTMGLMQAISIIPGISRSGTTISTGLILGVNREDAARFSFLLSIPAIIGSMIVEGDALAASGISYTIIASSVLISAVVGYLSLKLLWKTILEKRFHLFAYYCWTLGLALALAQIL